MKKAILYRKNNLIQTGAMFLNKKFVQYIFWQNGVFVICMIGRNIEFCDRTSVHNIVSPWRFRILTKISTILIFAQHLDFAHIFEKSVAIQHPEN